jgi:DNA-binding CsgD family transcriptional regulator/tetratricopeptide (TPR) repeat protein/energy-coupling factor transporter ATP-binding protein EcfA2
MEILERDTHLLQLVEYLEQASRGKGRLVFLCGESGSGKTTLVEHFARKLQSHADFSIVSCDGLKMPGPFGPLFDIAEVLGPEVEAVLRAREPHDRIFRTVLTALRDMRRANVLVGEDIHWTDEASLELIRFLGRRIGTTRTLLIVTYRDDTLDPFHPLRRVLGDLVNEPAVSRMWLPPLSLDAVKTLAAGSGIDPVTLHSQTGGNPFYVTEIVATGYTTFPTSIRDAVLGRASQVSVECRAVIDVAAELGVEFDFELLEKVIGAPIATAVEDCLQAGIFRHIADRIAFRHGLARFVFQTAMSAPRRRELHRRILQIMESDPSISTDFFHLAQHAEDARDHVAVLRYATAAAAQAAAFGSHREAADQYARALRFSSGLAPAEIAALLEARSYECYLTGQLDDAISERARAVEIRESLDDRLKTGDNLRWLSRFYWFAGRNVEALEYAERALEILGPLEPGPELAMAFSNYSQLCMLASNVDEAILWGEKAIDLATRLDSPPILAHALTNVGTARAIGNIEAGTSLIVQGMDIARDYHLYDDVARCLANLTFRYLQHYLLNEAKQYLDEGIAFTQEHDLIAMNLYLRALQSLLLLSHGDWSPAVDQAREAADHPSATAPTRIVALTIIALVKARIGQDAASELDDTLKLAERSGELQRLGPVRAARAEAAWLAGDVDRAVTEALFELDHARNSGDRWLVGQLAIWPHRCGHPIEDLSTLAEPFALEIVGETRESAEIWRSRGCPLEQARALASSDDEAQLRDALDIVEQLNGSVDRARITRTLRSMGARNIPRGARPETRANPAHLTSRELEVLEFLLGHQSNKDIAEALFLSPRTVEHHVAAILDKLQVSSRAEIGTRLAELETLRSGLSDPPT